MTWKYSAEHLAIKPTRREALFVSVGLSTLFVVVYNTTNWITSRRVDVGTWYYEWERSIPFVPAMILPYMSIDLFFVAAPFLCADRAELQMFIRRITATILIAGAVFLCFPLTLAVDRPHATGAMGSLFNWFRTVDLPYNLFPSLHIALRTLLADTYARHTRGLVKWASHIWFSLIGISTLLTYQHHVVDVVSGFLLALLVLYCIRESPLRMPVERQPGMSRWYAAGSVMCLLIAFAARPWSLLSLWPALSLGLVAFAYAGLGPGVFGKRNGTLPMSSRLVLAPVLLGQYLSLLYYRRECRPWDPVTSTIWIGGKLTNQAASQALRHGVTAVLDLTVAFDEVKLFRDNTQVIYHQLPVLDLTAPTDDALRQAVQFVEQQSKKGIVFVHCKIGYSRSAAVVGASLLASGECKTADDAMALLRRSRPTIVIRPEAENAIRRFERSLNC